MNKYLHSNENFRIHTFYSRDIHDNIPPECIQVTEEVWQKIIERPQDYKVKENLSTDITYNNIDDVVYIEKIVEPLVIKDDMPTDAEIEFAEYIIATEDRLAAIEKLLNGGI